MNVQVPTSENSTSEVLPGRRLLQPTPCDAIIAAVLRNLPFPAEPGTAFCQGGGGLSVDQRQLNNVNFTLLLNAPSHGPMIVSTSCRKKFRRRECANLGPSVTYSRQSCVLFSQGRLR